MKGFMRGESLATLLGGTGVVADFVIENVYWAMKGPSCHQGHSKVALYYERKVALK